MSSSRIPPSPSAQQALAAPQPTPADSVSPPSKRDLKSWWKGFKKDQPKEESKGDQPSHIWRVPLRQSITYANVAISLQDAQGKSYIYGYVPIVVAKCGVYLKEHATTVEGIFRLSGSERRIKELQTIFDSPDRYGKGLDWTGYTVHDAANVLRRYLNHLPEPIVPLDLYERFREPLRGHAYEAVGDSEAEPQYAADFDKEKVIGIYQQLITELPALNRQLLLYILDLLAVFASKADENRMGSANLAAIFQPGMLSHPDHAMSPAEYQLNQCVLIFLIQHQDHFLIGMRGTAADEQTVQAVQKGGIPPANTPSTPVPRAKTGVNRTASNASAGADSIRKFGGIRRNVSTSSRHSRQSNGAPSPASPASLTQQTSNSGVHRSNTVPSKRSPALPSSRRPKDSLSPSPKPSPSTAGFPPSSPNTVRGLSPLMPARRNLSPAHETASLAARSERSQEPLLPDVSEAKPEPRERNVSSLFSRSPTTTDGEKRAPNKLRKKRIPGSSNPSAQSSSNSLNGLSSAAQSPLTNPTLPVHAVAEHPQLESVPSANPLVTETHPTPPVNDNLNGPAQARLTDSNHSSEGTLKPKPSSTSMQSLSTSNDHSDINHTDTDTETTEKRRRWRMSRRKESQGAQSLGSDPANSKMNLGSNAGADMSSNSVASAQPQKNMSGDSASDPTSSTQAQQTGIESNPNNKEEKKGPIDWLKTKMREEKEKKRERDAEKERTKSPSSDAAKPEATPKPLDLKDDDVEKTADAQST